MTEQIQKNQINPPVLEPASVVVEKKKINPITIAILLIAILLVVGGAAYGAYTFGKKSTPPVIPPQAEIPTSIPTQIVQLTTIPTSGKSEESFLENTSVSGQKRYVSPKLGISFLFAEKDGNGEKVLIKEIGNKIYLYGGGLTFDKGQYVEVFSKNESQSLKEAIQEKLLSGYSGDKCTVTTEKTFPNYPSSYEIANIQVAGSFDDMEKLFEALKDCPSPYTQSNGMSYFLSDKNHPDKFVFFSIGQYLINKAPTGDQGWQDSIEFLD